MKPVQFALVSLAAWSLACAPNLSPVESTEASAAEDSGTGGEAGSADTSASDTTSDTSSTGDGDAETGDGDGAAECGSDAECQLLDDCCSCEAFPDEYEPMPCPADCFVSSCTSIGMHDASASCRLGGCQIAAVSCDPAQVFCNVPPPDCADGRLPRVADGCWDGCIEPRYCDVLPACSTVDCGDGWICVESQVGSFAPHCEPRPATCGPTASWCECLAPYPEVCQGGCEEGFSGGVLCLDGG